MTPEQEHTLTWNDRLQDRLDGDLAPADGAAFEAHLADCGVCQRRLAQFRQLDEDLQAAAPATAPDRSFDERLFARIDVIDEVQRAAARERAEAELRENLRALSRSWRRMLGFVVPGVVAGVALAFVLTGYFVSADVTHELVEGASTLGGNGNAGLIQTMLTTVVGAGIGAGVARWLASVAE